VRGDHSVKLSYLHGRARTVVSGRDRQNVILFSPTSPSAASPPASSAAITRPRATGTWMGTILRSSFELDQMKA
jgi:hypothetical protein